PVEAFSQNRFPTIKAAPYFFTFGPHDFFWLSLEPELAPSLMATAFEPPSLEAVAVIDERGDSLWETVIARLRTPFFEQQILPNYLRSCRWFGGKAHP